MLLLSSLEQALDLAQNHVLWPTGADALVRDEEMELGQYLLEAVDVPDRLQDRVHEAVQLARLVTIHQLEADLRLVELA